MNGFNNGLFGIDVSKPAGKVSEKESEKTKEPVQKSVEKSSVDKQSDVVRKPAKQQDSNKTRDPEFSFAQGPDFDLSR